jgi:RNA polymerase sigma-70 factor (ECF subfamily)
MPHCPRCEGAPRRRRRDLAEQAGVRWTSLAMESENVDESIRSAWESSEFNRATTLTLERYGPEVFGWIFGIVRDEDAASDVFSTFSEQLWSGFATFGWRCSVRTWGYAIARRATLMHLRTEGRRQRRVLALSTSDDVSAMAVRVRTSTLSMLRTDNLDAIARLRDRLPAEDRMLLVLRVDRDLSWDALARIFLDDAAPDAATLKRESARLRKRFQIVRGRLLEMAREAGLVPDP